MGKVVALPGAAPVALTDLAREPDRAADRPRESRIPVNERTTWNLS